MTYCSFYYLTQVFSVANFILVLHEGPYICFQALVILPYHGNSPFFWFFGLTQLRLLLLTGFSLMTATDIIRSWHSFFFLLNPKPESSSLLSFIPSKFLAYFRCYHSLGSQLHADYGIVAPAYRSLQLYSVGHWCPIINISGNADAWP